MRDYFSAQKGAVRMNVVVPFGEGARSNDYLVVNNIAIDKGDTKRLVKKKIGEPSYIGTTIEGYQFYRYEEEMVEIYFDGDRVCDWTRLQFKP